MDNVKVFGSAIVRIAPDTATILIAVTRLEMEPKNAFARAREGARDVNAYLQKSGIKEFGSSRVTLSQEFDWRNAERKFRGYNATIAYSVVLRDLDRVDEVLSGLINAGANELTSVTFETTRLKEIRADARKRAIMAAREKAMLYCDAAGVKVGRVIAIEDANPERLTGRQEGHVRTEPVIDDTGDVSAIDPASITVGAAVNVTYELA